MLVKLCYYGQFITLKPWMQIDALFTIQTLVVGPILTYSTRWFLGLYNICPVSIFTLLNQSFFGLGDNLRRWMMLFPTNFAFGIDTRIGSLWRRCFCMHKFARIFVTSPRSPVYTSFSINFFIHLHQLCIHNTLQK